MRPTRVVVFPGWVRRIVGAVSSAAEGLSFEVAMARAEAAADLEEVEEEEERRSIAASAVGLGRCAHRRAKHAPPDP